MTKGFVYLVGAGPGDLDLATVRARELIATADVVVYDYLVHPAMLGWCRPDCEKIYVGKRPHQHALPQEDIEALLVAKARAGQRVVRLKGGDPFVFGRGGEEVRRLAADSIPFEVVPGVTAALAAGAYAGIPLTQRNTSSSLILLTGHEDPTTHSLAVEWRRFGAIPHATLAIYMGMGHLRQILDELMAGGLPANTPAAAVEWASLGRQRSITGSVSTLADAVEAARLAPPAMILVGEVVRGHEAIDWFEQRPLFGRRIAVTRSREQAGELRRRLEALGAEAIELPLVEIRAHTDRTAVTEVLAAIAGYQWLVFTSANGVRHFFEIFFKAFNDLRCLGGIQIACVGEATARAVRALHVEVAVCPATASAEALADAMVSVGSLDNLMVLVVTGNLNRDTLVKRLEKARAIVDCLQVYENHPVDLTGNPVAEEFRQRGADAVMFASASAVRSYVSQTALQLSPEAKRPLAGSIGPMTSEAMREAGIPPDFEARESTLDGLITALLEKLASG